MLDDAARLHELENFVEIFQRIRPPKPGASMGEVEIFGHSLFLNGSAGGDHIVYVNFSERYDLDRRIEQAAKQGLAEVAAALEQTRSWIGILLADVSGHSMTDALVAAMLHQAFLTGVLYELERYGEVTTRLFENLNTRFFSSVSVTKYITLIYGELSSTGTFRFISAGHPRPLIFSSAFDAFVTIAKDRLISFYPLGMFPSADDVDADKHPRPLRYKEQYSVNEVNLMGSGDILLLYTDGLAEHARDDQKYLPLRLEHQLRALKGGSAEAIYNGIMADILDFAEPEDDISIVVIKRR